MNDLNIAQGKSLFEQTILSPQWYVFALQLDERQEKNSILSSKYFWN